MGVALWEALLANPATPAALIDELYAMELQRIVLNMQISLTHSIARRQACASKAAQAEAAYLRRVHGRRARSIHHRSHHEHALRRRGQHRFGAGLPRIPERQRRAAPAALTERLFRQPDPEEGRRL